MAAVAETAGSRSDTVMGNKRVAMAALTSVDNTDTWDSGLALVEQVIFTPTTAGAGTQWGATTSGGTVTFAIESGTLAGKVMAFGT